MLAKSKLNSNETLAPHALIDMEVSHEEFNTIMKEKKNMRRWKKCEDCKCESRKYDIKKCKFKDLKK